MASFCGEAKPNTLCGGLFDRLLSRRLLKRVFQERIQKFSEVEMRDKLLTLGGKPKTEVERKANDKLRKGIEAALGEVLSEHFHGEGEKVDPLEVILHVFDIKSVRTTSRNDESGIPIATRGTPVFFEDESALFASINESYTEGFVEVYAPAPPGWSDRTQRSKWLKALSAPIRQSIESIVKPTLRGES